MTVALSRNQENLIQSLYTRHGRKKSGLCLCEGVRCCEELFKGRPDLVDFIVCRENLDMNLPPVPVYRVPDFKLQKLSLTEASQGVLAVARRPEYVDPAEPPVDPFALVLDQVGDPGNFGTILRTAKAAGLHEVWFTSGSTDPFSDKVIRSAMSSQFLLQLRQVPDLAALKEYLEKAGYHRVFRTDPHQGGSCFTEPHLFERSAVIIGSEAHGASELAGSVPVTIPMPGNFESLNAAQAATIFIFEYVRRITK